MKAIWAAQARRIDGLSLRERAIMFVSIAVALAALADTLWLTPLMAQQKALTAQLQQQTRELQVLRQRLAATTQPVAPDTPQGRLQAAVARTQASREALAAELRQLGAEGAPATRLPELLASVLRRHERLTLLRLTTAAPAPSPGAAGAEPALPLQGVDLSLAGAYADLVQYLAEIERTLPGLRWGELRIQAATQPPVLSLRLFLMGEMR